ncbi:uncharacterized protein LOC103705251 isoform X1 [Phoenix dactylifera]|uniref:Uncharacterized protein LOC103705251 isoform X1 n=1 Tax=Phoenix dactylifera TaxID=42345 RepID=A0A8B9AJG7_PHODC|nr:uncharacterized protein LOC103705251 isoform X1 [Phoenix dactylifera]
MAAPSASIAVANATWEQIKSSRSVSDDHLSILHFLFGKNLERATRIVDQGGVRRVSGAPSGRSLFLVVGESKRKEEYICFPENHCTCYSFFYDIVNWGEQLCVCFLICFTSCFFFLAFSVTHLSPFCSECKHQIAARLAEAVGALTEVEVSDEQLALMLAKL